MSSTINLKLGARKPPQTGKPDASAMEMERRIIWVRWLAILVSLGALPFLSSSLSQQSLVTLLALIGLGAIYNLTLLVIILPRKPGWLTSGYISAIGDTLLVTGGVAVTGGLDSPFFLAYFVVTVTTAFCVRGYWRTGSETAARRPSTRIIKLTTVASTGRRTKPT